MQKNGIAWFPVELIHWNIIPIFTPKAIKHLALTANAFQKSFHKTKGIQKSLSCENMMFELFRDHLRSSEYDGLVLGAQLIIQSYIQEVLSLLTECWTDGPKDLKKWLKEFLARVKLEDSEVSGMQGLSLVMVAELIGSEPQIVAVWQSDTSTGSRHERSHFSQYNTGLWKDKLFTLFAWDDERAGATKK